MKFVEFEREQFFSRLIWLVPIFYLFHIIEEFNGFADWVTNVIGGEITVSVFLRNNAVFMAITIALCLLAYFKRKQWATALFFFWATGLMFWNYLFHMYAQYRFHAYSPGYFTGTFLYLPTAYYLSYLGLRERFLPWYLWLIVFVVAGLVMIFSLWGLLYHFGAIPWEKWI